MDKIIANYSYRFGLNYQQFDLDQLRRPYVVIIIRRYNNVVVYIAVLLLSIGDTSVSRFSRYITCFSAWISTGRTLAIISVSKDHLVCDLTHASCDAGSIAACFVFFYRMIVAHAHGYAAS